MRVPENINIKKVTPTFTSLITTMEKYEKDGVTSTGLLDTSKQQGQLKEFQYVIAVGPSVRNCKVGDLVKINPSAYAQYKQRKVPNVAEEIEGYSKQLTGYQFRTIELNGDQHLFLQDNDIEYVINEFENIEPPKILNTANKIIL